MFAFLLVSTIATLGYLCVAAGFLVILASVLFVIKGKAVLGDSGAPNEVAWGKMKLNLTSAVFLFVLGAVMIALPFWRFQELDALLQVEGVRQPNTAILTGRIAGSRDLRLLLVAKPDYDQTYRGDIVWEVPLVGKRASYSVFYIDGNTIVNQQPFFVNAAAAGSAPQKIALPVLDLQTGSSTAPDVAQKKEVSDADLKKLGIH